MTTTTQKLGSTNVSFAAVTAALLLATLPSVSNAEAWELRTAPDTVPGTHEIESGKIDKAIRLSTAWLPHIARQEKVAVLNNLCIGYILSKEFDQAEEYCDRAVEHLADRTVSYNNRGVLRALQGDYDGAVQDFASASSADCADGCSSAVPKNPQQPRAVAMRNFDRAEYQAKAGRMNDDDQIAALTD
jgi:tetratricopeptide (TPR) repeat protein